MGLQSPLQTLIMIKQKAVEIKGLHHSIKSGVKQIN